MIKEIIIIGTRGSILALAQAEKVKEMLEEKNKNVEIELKVIVTKGDRDFRDFKKIQGTSQKDLFVKEIEKEMLEGIIDLAVHSLKDMPQETPEGLFNACFPLREDNADVLISKNDKTLMELETNSVIGTGSTRREVELLNLRKDIQIKPIRGNIHTRLKKLDDGEYDAIILAAAGLKRVGLDSRITERFSSQDFIPAPGQGILCIQCRENDEKILKLLETLEDEEVRIMCETEREFSRIFDGGCHTPIGCSSKIKGENIEIQGMFNHNGKRIFEKITGSKYDGVKLARELANKIKGVVGNE